MTAYVESGWIVQLKALLLVTSVGDVFDDCANEQEFQVVDRYKCQLNENRARIPIAHIVRLNSR